MSAQFTKLVVYVEHKGKPYRVIIAPEYCDLATKMLAGFSDNGTLKLIETTDLKFVPMVNK